MKILQILVALITSFSIANGQTINATYVKALYEKYPTLKSDFCPACKLWINPYYKSIADTERNTPILTYQLLTKENYAKTDSIHIPRKGIYASWHAVTGQADESKVYVAANRIVRKKGDLISKGHCNAWILNAFSHDSAILSNTYTFNAALENQSQNVGTEIATENITRKLLATNDVQVWCGTAGSQGTFTDGKITCTYPAIYWKVIKCEDSITCYWMPNLITEKQNMLPKRVISYSQLIANLGFDPMSIFN